LRDHLQRPVIVRETAGCLIDTVSIDNVAIYNERTGKSQYEVNAYEVNQVQVKTWRQRRNRPESFGEFHRLQTRTIWAHGND